MADSSLSLAPWTEEEVVNLEAWQACSWAHPYTCGPCREADPGGRDEHKLVATRNGWRCPTCDYRQSWCWVGMLGPVLPNPFDPWRRRDRPGP